MAMFNKEMYGNVKSKVWILIHVPYSDPEFEYEIIPHSHHAYIPLDALKRGAKLNLRFNKATTECFIVGIAGSLKAIQDNLASLKRDYLSNTNPSPNTNLITMDQQDIKPRAKKEKSTNDANRKLTNTENNMVIDVLLNGAYGIKKSNITKVDDVIHDDKMGLVMQLVSSYMVREWFADNNKLRDKLRWTINVAKQKRTLLTEPFAPLDKLITDYEEALRRLNKKAEEYEKCQDRIKIMDAWRAFEKTQFYRDNLHLPVNMFFAGQAGDGSDPYMTFGSNKTQIKIKAYKNVPWTGPCSAVTRELLKLIFTREQLATRTLSGKVSPAFPKDELEVKGSLDQRKLADIVQIIYAKTSYSTKQIRAAITTKCADENKMLKERMRKDPHMKLSTYGYSAEEARVSSPHASSAEEGQSSSGEEKQSVVKTKIELVYEDDVEMTIEDVVIRHV